MWKPDPKRPGFVLEEAKPEPDKVQIEAEKHVSPAQDDKSKSEYKQPKHSQRRRKS